MSEEFEKFKLEYQTLVDGVKLYFDSFYKLATMTFAFNASLATALGVLLRLVDSPGKWITSGMIAFIGAFYNFAALRAYNQALGGTKDLIAQIHELAKSQKGMDKIVSVSRKENFTKKKASTGVQGVLILLIMSWLGALIFVICSGMPN